MRHLKQLTVYLLIVMGFAILVCYFQVHIECIFSFRNGKLFRKGRKPQLQQRNDRKKRKIVVDSCAYRLGIAAAVILLYLSLVRRHP